MKAEGVCEITCIDEQKVTAVKARLLPDKVLSELAETFRVLGDGTRAKIIHAISLEELCVCDIAMGGNGTDAAIETADIDFMSDDITKIPWLIGHAQRTLRVVRQNIAFALLFMAWPWRNSLLCGWRLPQIWGHRLSLIVIFNALRLLNGKAK